MKNDFIISSKEHMRLIVRGLKTIKQIQPRYIITSFFLSVFLTLMPFIDIYFGANIINEITNERRIEILLQNLAVMVFLDFFVTSICKYLYGKVRVFRILSPSAEEVLLNCKSSELEYSQCENAENQNTRQRIVDNRNNGGLQKLVVLLIETTCNLSRIVVSVVMMSEILIVQNFSSATKFLSILNSNFTSFLVLILTVFLGVGYAKITLKKNKEVLDYNKCLSNLYRPYNYFLFDYFGSNKSLNDLHVYNQKDLVLNKVSSVISGFISLKEKAIDTNAKTEFYKNSLLSLINIFVYVLISLRAFCGAIGLGFMIKYINLVKQLLHSVVGLSENFALLISNNFYLKDIFQYLDLPSIKDLGHKSIGDTNEEYNIEFKNVSFSYPGSDRFALENISFTISKGQHLALVGQNGSGKSTIIKLLCRLYTPNEGYILLNGKSIYEYKFDEYIKTISSVFQDYQMLPISIGQNISSSILYNDKKVWNCIELIGLKNRFCNIEGSLQKQLFKDLNEDGFELSGGELQKLAIARAIHKDSAIVILDEPTAALDPFSEVEVFEQFNEIAKDKTGIFISHRLFACKFCDLIFVLDKGKLVQSGTHNELVNCSGKYKEMWESQSQYYMSN